MQPGEKRAARSQIEFSDRLLDTLYEIPADLSNGQSRDIKQAGEDFSCVVGSEYSMICPDSMRHRNIFEDKGLWLLTTVAAGRSTVGSIW